MKQAVKLVIVVAVIIVCIVVVRKTFKRHAFNAQIQEAHAIYEEANTAEDFQASRAAYADLEQYASGREERRMVEAGIVSSEAWIAYLETMNKPDLAGYARTIDLMERVIDLTDDPDNVWEPKLAQMRRLHTDALGPDIQTMRARFERGRAQPFELVLSDLEGLYRWQERWAEQGRHQNDPELDRFFGELHAYLVEAHSKRLEDAVAAARRISDDDRDPENLGIVARPPGLIGLIEHHAPEKAAEYRERFANDFVRAQRAQRLLEAMQQ